MQPSIISSSSHEKNKNEKLNIINNANLFITIHFC